MSAENQVILVSVAITTYNQEKFIKQAIESVLMQEADFEYEIVIGEDCSTDNTREILLRYKQEHPSRIKLVLQDKNVGATQNACEVFSRCKGRYIALLEGDDYWVDPLKLQKQVGFLEQHSDFIGVSGGVRFLYNNTKLYTNRNIYKKTYYSGVNDYFDNPNRVPVMTLTLLFRNLFLQPDNIKSYSKLVKNCRMLGDLQFKIFLLSKGRIKYLDDIMAVYRINSSVTAWSSKSIDFRLQEFENAWENIIEFLGNVYMAYDNKYLDESYSSMFFQYLRTGDSKKAYYCLKKVGDKKTVFLYYFNSIVYRLKRLLFETSEYINV